MQGCVQSTGILQLKVLLPVLRSFGARGFFFQCEGAVSSTTVLGCHVAVGILHCKCAVSSTKILSGHVAIGILHFRGVVSTTTFLDGMWP